MRLHREFSEYDGDLGGLSVRHPAGHKVLWLTMMNLTL